MPDLTAKRTLVKSAPELWGELSEAERLGKHLEAFGDIKITKLEPEHTVAWEGEHASGTVSIEPSGWGTKVTLTAELDDVLEPDPGPPAEEAPAEVSVADIAEDIPPYEEEPLAVAEAEEPEATTTRRGFWSWLFRREPRPEPAVAEPEPEPEPEAMIAAAELDPFIAKPGPDPVEPVEPEAETAEPEPAEPEPEPPPGIAADEARAVLDETLEALGAAHHRPFSRG
jgi:hypothetical protein